MIGTIRKHSAWLWVVIIAVTIFSFIYWGSSRYDPSRSGKAYYGSIDGEPVSRDELTDAYRDWVSGSDRFGPVHSRLPRVDVGPPPWLRAA